MALRLRQPQGSEKSTGHLNMRPRERLPKAKEAEKKKTFEELFLRKIAKESKEKGVR